MRSVKSFFSVLLILSLASQELKAQGAQWISENHRIQYQKFAWKFVASSNFEVYYLDKNEPLAKASLSYLESDFVRVTELLSYSPVQKIKIFLYPNHETWLQSNGGISLANAKEVEEQNLAKFRIEIPFKDNLGTFKQELTKQVVRVYLQDLLYGGSVRDVLQNSLLLSVSDWYVLGMAAYIASGDTPEMRRFTYQIISENKIRKLPLAKGKEAELLGQSIWAYIAATYGKQSIGNILNLTRIIRSEQSSVASTIRKPFAKFLKDWFDYYLNDAKQLEVNSQKIFAQESFVPAQSTLLSYRLSPDGLHEVWVSDESGRYSVNFHTVGAKKTHVILQSGLKDVNRLSTGKGPLLSWFGTNQLAVLFSDRGYSWIKLFQVDKSGALKGEDKKKVANLSYLDMEMSKNGAKMLVRVLEKGQVDVGIYDLKRNRLNPVTKDAFDEKEAHLLPDNRVIYLTDRYIDSLPAPVAPFTSAFVWNPDEPENPTRLFSTSGTVSNFQFRSDSIAYFLHAQSQGNRLIRYSLADSTFQQLSIRSVSWDNFEISPTGISSKEKAILEDKVQRFSWNSLDEMNTSGWIPTIEDPVLAKTLEVVPTETTSDLAKKSRRARLDRQQSIRLKKEPSKLIGPLDYENSLVMNSSEGQFSSDPIRGLGYGYELKANDLLENHLFKAGVFLTANLRNTDIWGEYSYLANKLDWKFRYDRKVLGQDTESESQKIRHNRFALSATYPFSLLSRITFTGSYATNRLFSQFSLSNREEYAGYAGTSVNYVFDNTVPMMENIRTGMRLSVLAEVNKEVMNEGDFVRLGIDARYYKKLTNSFFLATRFSASHQVGSRTQASMLGGVDNWLINQQETRTQDSPLGLANLAQRDVFMSHFIAPLRGFALNKLSGNSHLLLNVELRMPVRSLISMESSSLLNTVQLVGFTDVGTAWSGSSPFAKSNGFNTNVYGGNMNPFRATVTDYRNPFLVGYGFGARATIFGYFVKFDYAFGIENKEVKSPMTYLSLGYDF
ncbi:hypothetical protein SKC37_01535 [Aquirufa sp. HETE-83D]|uniref:Uncharacterized protein n=1 Tax=Aquirufa esocilacus TaxID=3096513 RepID=A0ABW6DI29_9BACT